MNSVIDTILSTVVYLSAAFVLFFIGKLIYKLTHPSINVKEELVFKDNFAFSLSHVGYFLGLLLAIGGAIIGESKGIKLDLIEIGVYGAIAIVLMNISIFINDKLLLRKFSNRKEIIEDQNAGTGVVEGSASVATGLIILGAVYGEGGGIDTALVFWAIGQLMLIVTAFVYNMILPYNIHEHIEKDNVAVGIGFAGALLAIANLIRHAIMHDFVSWQSSCFDICITVIVGLVLLPVVRFLTDKILLPGQRLTDEIVNQEKPNNGAAMFEAFAYIGGSILITWCI